MPKTIINEFDNTGSVSTPVLTNTVYIPVKIQQTVTLSSNTYTFKQLDNSKTDADLLPHLILSEEELESFAEDGITATYEFQPAEGDPVTTSIAVTANRDIGFDLAKFLLNNGCYVLLQVVSSDTSDEWTARLSRLQDKGLYDFKFLCLGDFAGTTSATSYSIASVISCAEKRGDCIALIDHPEEANDLLTGLTGVTSSSTYSEIVHAWVEKNVVSSYAATFSPWCSNTMHVISTINGATVTKTYPMLPPSFSFLAAYAQSVKSNPSWLAAAGAFRGFIPGLVKVEHKYGEKDVDNLQCRKTTFTGSTESFANGDNVGVACNPICNIEPFGIIIWGNRTCLQNTADGLKATSLLNIRSLACDIKKTMWKAARKYTFEQNTLRLWLNFCSQVRPLLDQAKVGEGISSYRFIQETTTARARLKAKLIIVPIDAVEDFELSFVMDNTVETEESVA